MVHDFSAKLTGVRNELGRLRRALSEATRRPRRNPGPSVRNRGRVREAAVTSAHPRTSYGLDPNVAYGHPEGGVMKSHPYDMLMASALSVIQDAPTRKLSAGSKIKHYEVIRKLGQGGMGTV